MIQRWKGNESGAALMIVLFIVVLVSIVGTAMLSTTTYGLQNVVKTKKEQEEFYRAEGAIEIVLSEMSNYKNTSTGNSGPFAYLKDITNNTKTYRIGEKDVQVKITTDPVSISSITPNSSTKTIKVSLQANYVDSNQTNITRKMDFDVKVNADPLTKTKTAYGYVAPGHFDDKNQFKPGLRSSINAVDYQKVITDLGINWSNYTNSLGPNEIKNGDTYIFPAGITTLSSMSINGGNEIVKIPKGSIVYVQSISIGGSGNATSQLIIEGALITESITHDGNSVVIVNSGIIAKNYNGTANFVVDGKGEGIECSDIKGACSIINGTTASNTYKSTIDSSSINFSTNR
ncbi:hypothetical protein M3175_19965 [Robertmurraya korlensis]|uniref:hypothetical protein n=1 Tax=Robertmurraya korlensis TaxID=519977 RepID=UPI00203C664B|nr:hypothetical protein [Robertmurraya korlensis]MCM3603019.1 hypothetical protein [Robertmurraya korlensis]